MPAHTLTPLPLWALCSQSWHQQTTRLHDAIHTIWHLLCTVETGIHPWKTHFSSVPVAIEGENLPTEVSHDTELQSGSGQDTGADNEHADELPWDGFWQLVQKFFTCANPQFHQLSGWVVSDDPAGEEAGCGVPGLAWLHVLCGCEAGWTYCQILYNDIGGSLW
jgi:hypothetical protein